MDGECVSEVTRNYTVYETDVPGEYTTKPNNKAAGILAPVRILSGFGPAENYMNPIVASYYSKLPTKEAKKEFGGKPFHCCAKSALCPAEQIPLFI